MRKKMVRTKTAQPGALRSAHDRGARYAKLEPQDVTQPHEQQLFHTEQVQTVSGPPWGAPASPGSKHSTRKVLPSTGERVVRGGAWGRGSLRGRAGGLGGLMGGVWGGGVAGCSIGVLQVNQPV